MGDDAFYDSQSFAAHSRMSNQQPVDCAGCNGRILAHGANKLMLDERDPSDYDWYCPPCYERKIYG